MTMGEFIIGRKSCENTGQSLKLVSPFTFFKAIQWSRLKIEGRLWAPGLMFDTTALVYEK